MALTTRVLTNASSPLTAPDGTILAGKTVTFTLVDQFGAPISAFDGTTGQRVVGVVSAVLDANGEFSVSLWPNDRGSTTTRYACTVNYVGAEAFSSQVPSGATAYSWLEFRLAGVVFTAAEQSALTLHAAATNAHGIGALSAALTAFEATKDASGGFVGLTLFKINFKNALNTFTSFFTNANTGARTYTFKDRDGTIADVQTIQDAETTWCGTAGGTANAITLSPSPAITAYKAGRSFRFKNQASTNTAAVTVAISGLATPRAIQKQGAALVAGDMVASKWYDLLDDGTAFQLVNVDTAAQIPSAIQNQSYTWCGISTGSANAITLTPSPAFSGYVAGQRFIFIAGYTNTGAVTVNISASGNLNLLTGVGGSTALVAGEIVVGRVYEVVVITGGVAYLSRMGSSYDMTRAVNFAKGTAIASATTIDPFGVADGNVFHVTGSTLITGFTAAPYAGMTRTLIFDSACGMNFAALANNPMSSYASGTTGVFPAGSTVTILADTTSTFTVLSWTAPGNGGFTMASASFDLSTASGTSITLAWQYASFKVRNFLLVGAIAGHTGGVPMVFGFGGGLSNMDGSGNNLASITQNTAGAFGANTASIILATSAAAYQQLTVGSIATTGITFSNTKVSTPTGTVTLYLIGWA